MAKPSDRVHPLKTESAAEGGDAADDNMGLPARLNPTEDALAMAGAYFGESGKDGSDKIVTLYREGDELYFEDNLNAAASRKSLSNLSGGGITESQHEALRQLIHFIDDGPASGFPSGSYREALPSGGIFPTSEIWWESSSKLKKIVSLDTTWSGATITQEIWKVYDTDGTTVLATVTDAISYSGVIETTRTRTIA